MSRLRPAAALALGWACLWAASAAADSAAKPVKLGVETQRKLGLATQTLMAVTRTASIPGFARVLDVGPLAQLDGDIAVAEVGAAASAAEAARARGLHDDGQTVSTKQLQAEQAQASADALRLAALRRRLGLEWGAGLARMSDRRRAALVENLAAGRAALLRIDTAAGEGQAGLAGVEVDLGALGVVHAVVLGPSRSADPRLVSPGLIAEVAGRTAGRLSAGLSTPVRPTASRPLRGVILPRAALVRSDGQAWAYLRTGDDSFVRRPVRDSLADPDGLFTASGFRPGEAVVTAGAAALFAAETNTGQDNGD